MGKCILFIFIIALTALADTTDSSLRTPATQIVKADLSNTIMRVEITNLPQKDFWDKYLPLLGVLIGALLGWGLSYFTQKRMIIRQLAVKQNDDWINKFRNTVTEITSSLFHIFYKMSEEGYSEIFEDEFKRVEVKIYYNMTLLNFYCSSDNLLHNQLVDKIAEIRGKILKRPIIYPEIPEEIKKCLLLSDQIIKEKEKEILKNN
jgi:hypothetical protein